MRRIGILMSLAAGDRESEVRLRALLQALRDCGWTIGCNLEIDTLWGADNVERTHDYATKLVGLEPDVLLASGSAAAAALRQATHAVPIVFVQVAEPLGGGLVKNMARPEANITGFASIEHGVSAKWLELLKEIEPRIARTVVVRDSTSAAGRAQFEPIRSLAAALGVHLSPVGVHDAGDIERGITALARELNGGLIVTTSTRASSHRNLIVALAARHRLPAIYPFRFYVAGGGLMSYGPDWIDQYRRAAGYVDRILRGEEPAHLPVQTPAKYQLAINLKAAEALGVAVPPMLLTRADEVIE